MIFGMCIGFLAGALIINIYLKNSENNNILLKKTINNLENDIDLVNLKVSQRDNLIKDYQKENEILLNDLAKLRNTKIDLENNIELLINNLSIKNKKIVKNLNQD